MTRAYIGLGANLGDAKAAVRQAAVELAAANGVASLRLSPLYRSAPVDSAGPDYINAVAAIDTSLDPQSLLALLQSIEQQHGRQRPYRNAPRTLDLDLLLFGDQTINDDHLIVPHPRMHLRAFVLKPLADLAPDLLLAQGSVKKLLSACRDQQLAPLQNY